MSKRTFDVVLLTGAFHIVQADSFDLDDRYGVVFREGGRRIAYFSGVSSLIEQPQSAEQATDPVAPLAAPVLDSPSELGAAVFTAEPMLGGAVSINIHFDGCASASVTAEAVKAAVNAVCGAV